MINFLKSIHSVIFIFGSFLVLFSAGRFVTPNFLSQMSSIIPIGVLFLLVIVSIVYDDWFVHELVFFIMLIMYEVILYSHTRVAQPMYLALMIISMRRITPDTIMRNVFIVQTMLLLVNLTLYHFGLLYNFTSGPVTKHSYGFWTPNQLGVTVLQLAVILLILSSKGYFYKKAFMFKLIATIYFGLLMVLLYLSGSRGSEIATVVAITIFASLRLAKKLKKIPSRIFFSILAVLPFFMSLLTLNSSVNQVGSPLYKLNVLLTTRISLGNYFYQQYGVTLFGQNVVYHLGASAGVAYYFLDNEYLVYLINYGLLATTLFVGYIILLTNKAIVTKRYGLLIAIITFAVYGFVEQGAGEAWVNFSLCFISIFFIQNNATVSKTKMEV